MHRLGLINYRALWKSTRAAAISSWVLLTPRIVVLAEDLGIRRIATRDLRHFAAVRLRDGTSFDLVVLPTEPDHS
jgi:hypothetical protein